MNRKQRRELRKDKNLIIELYSIIKKYLPDLFDKFEEKDELNGLPIDTPPYIICTKCNFDKCVPLDYKSSRGFHHIYKEK